MRRRTVIDPVCGVEVVPEETKYKSVYEGQTYYFSSAECKRAFDEDPDLYVEDMAEFAGEEEEEEEPFGM
ncbi:MAG: YHS domain-containing protein [Anaerolineae bacterium]|nr:YHS domain-containing protein [Anaerolineae bacterium]